MSLQDLTGWNQQEFKQLKQLVAELLEFHPLANMFPLMRGKDFDILVADVKAYGGLREKIMLYQGKILDGRNRYRACLQARIEPQFEQFEGTEAEARAHLNRANLFRLHLKPKEKRVRMDTAIKAAPEKSDRQIAEEIGADHKTIGAARMKLERRGEIPHVAKRRDTKGREQPAKRNTAEKPAVSAEVEKIRNEAAARIRGLLGNNEPAAPSQQSSGEVEDDRGADHGANPGVDGGGNSHQDGSLDGDHGLDNDHRGGDHPNHRRHAGGGDHRGDDHRDGDELQRLQAENLVLKAKIAELETAAAKPLTEVLAEGTALQLVDALDHRLRHDGVNACTIARLGKIRAWIERNRPSFDLKIMLPAGAA
jgi:hypothetical protein